MLCQTAVGPHRARSQKQKNRRPTSELKGRGENLFLLACSLFYKGCGGEGEIRTLGTCYSTHAFQACTFSHSVTSPHFKPLYQHPAFQTSFPTGSCCPLRLGYCFKSERRFTPSPTHCQGVFSHFSGAPQKRRPAPPAPARKASSQHTGFIQKSPRLPEDNPSFKKPSTHTEGVGSGLLKPDWCPCKDGGHTKKTPPAA